MNKFSYSVNQKVLFGQGAIGELSKILEENHVTRILIVTDASLIKLGYVDKIKNCLQNSGVHYQVYSEIEPNPSVETVERAVETFGCTGAQAILAFGGGSPIDVAKATATLAAYGGKITDYEGLDKVPGKIIPIIAIPTTAGTGSEVTASAVITDHRRHFKFSVISQELIPKYAILDPDFILALPKQIAASTGVDAIVHAIEAYISKAATPFTDAMAEKALELLGTNIRPFVENRNNIEAASGMIVGSNFAGVAFARAKLGNVHAMAHPLGGYFNIPHGVANAVLLPVVIEYNEKYVCEEKYERIYRAISGNYLEPFCRPMLADAIRKLCAELDIPKNLTELQVDPTMIPNMAEDAIKSGNVAVNPRPTTRADMEALFHQAM